MMRAEDWETFFQMDKQLENLNRIGETQYNMTFKIKLGEKNIEIMSFKELKELYYSNFVFLFNDFKDEFLINKLYNFKEEDVVKNFIISRIAEWQLQ